MLNWAAGCISRYWGLDSI